MRSRGYATSLPPGSRSARPCQARLHRWGLGPELRALEERLIAAGELPATGARLVAMRR
jgi:hypothetical protein